MRGFAAIGLQAPKSAINVGSVLRAAGCYDAAMVAVTGRRYGRVATDTQRAYKHIPLLHVNDLHDAIPFDCVPIAIELTPNARELNANYVHPERAFYVFGPEDSSLDKDVTSWCRDTLYIPTRFCMNLAATVNVVLFSRALQRGFPGPHEGKYKELSERSCDDPRTCRA